LAATVALGGLLSTGVVASPAQAGRTDIPGCPSGYVCIYDDVSDIYNLQGYIDRRILPEHKWAAYGYHALQGEYDVHLVVNNQYGGAIARLCTGVGSGCGHTYAENEWHWENLTPINYVQLADR
jgi:hypothetical protein